METSLLLFDLDVTKSECCTFKKNKNYIRINGKFASANQKLQYEANMWKKQYFELLSTIRGQYKIIRNLENKIIELNNFNS